MGNNKGGKKYQNRKNSNSNVKRKEVENLEKTNLLDIVIDDERLSDKDSLDVSFVDGKKKNKAKEQAIEILEEEINYKEEASKIDVPKKKKNNEFISTFFIILFSFVLGFLICYIWARETGVFKSVKTVTKTVTETKVVVDENIVFLGDSIFEGYDLEKFYEGMNVVNSGVSGHTSEDLLENMENRVYRYNPSKVILLIGTNDLNEDVEVEKVVENIGKIVDGIKENRPHAEIYVQSVYPVNKSGEDDKLYKPSVGKRDNETIKSMNADIEKLCKEKNVVYMDLYDVLANDNGDLELEYTTEGLHITDEGYEVITDEVMKLFNNEKTSK